VNGDEERYTKKMAELIMSNPNHRASSLTLIFTNQVTMRGVAKVISIIDQ
jgi:hypothetical protein